MIKFGAGGNSKIFYDSGCKSTIEAPKWVSEYGLDAYEYECGNGINVQEASARKIGEEAKKYNIALSVHAPYFISLASEEEEKRQNSIRYIMNTLKVAKFMGATRIVVHPGGVGKRDRRDAFLLAMETMKQAVSVAKSEGYDDIYICPETMGKINQIGTVEEVIEMCKMDEILLPTIDFGHINARTMGGLKTEEDFESIIALIKNELGEERGNKFHVHFSKIEYTKGGEKRHLTFEDTEYGPDFTLLAKAMKKLKVTPTIICESAGTMAEDALTMKKIMEEID